MTFDETEMPDRIVPLEGAGNFRDFGGYGVPGGRVKRGLLYRSNGLSHLTSADIARLDALDIGSIFDLRAERERQAAPTAWQRSDLRVFTFRPGHKRRLVDMAQDYPPDEDGARQLMLDFYAELPRTMGHAFAEILQRMAGGAVPCVIHCSAGKDRTGMAVAIVLALLGVPRKIIVADYALTDRLGSVEADMARSVVKDPARDTLRSRYPAAAIKAMRAADPAYIRTAMDAIDAQYGGLVAYLEHVGVDAATQSSLRDMLIERG